MFADGRNIAAAPDKRKRPIRALKIGIVIVTEIVNNYLDFSILAY